MFFAAGLGLEPRYTPPEGVVLPLDDPAIGSQYKKRGSISIAARSPCCDTHFLLYFVICVTGTTGTETAAGAGAVAEALLV